MKLYVNHPSTNAFSLLNQINETISKLNSITDLAVEYNRCVEENKKLKTKTLPIYKEQESRYSLLLSKLEHKKNQITSELSKLSALHIVEKKQLQTELSKIKIDIAINYNNYSRSKYSVSEIIKKIDSNTNFIESHPLLDTTKEHQRIITSELNPAIEKLSNTLNISLVTYNSDSMFYIERYEIAGEESFELE